jgi:hypothetical protein
LIGCRRWAEGKQPNGEAASQKHEKAKDGKREGKSPKMGECRAEDGPKGVGEGAECVKQSADGGQICGKQLGQNGRLAAFVGRKPNGHQGTQAKSGPEEGGCGGHVGKPAEANDCGGGQTKTGGEEAIWAKFGHLQSLGNLGGKLKDEV